MSDFSLFNKIFYFNIKNNLQNTHEPLMDQLLGLPVSSSVILNSSFNRIKSDEWARLRKQPRNVRTLNVEGVTM